MRNFLFVLAFAALVGSVWLLWYGFRRKGRFPYIALYGVLAVSVFIFGVLDNARLVDTAVFEVMAAAGVAPLGGLVLSLMLQAWDTPWSLQEEVHLVRLNWCLTLLCAVALFVAACIVHRWSEAAVMVLGALVSLWLVYKWRQNLRELMQA